MLIDRRGFALSASALAVAGCAKTRPTAGGCSPLPPVFVDRARLIRTVAGIRPYRASGFVVRREALGDKALIHNYGHGGAGITLSWGSSRLAVDLGLPGHSGPVAVIGLGVMGLTTARLLQQAGFAVTIYTAALSADTTSAVAGGQISPFGHFNDDAVTPEWRAQFKAAMEYSWQRWQLLVGERYGVRWLPTYFDAPGGDDEGPSPYDAYQPGARVLGSREHPFPVERAARFNTMYVETPRFMAELTSEFLKAGGKVMMRRFASLADVTALDETLIFNCTGYGSRELVGDVGLVPIRGQLAVLTPQLEVQYAYTMPAGCMFPRGDGILLGGTFERGVSDPVPQPAAIDRILANHAELFASLRCMA